MKKQVFHQDLEGWQSLVKDVLLDAGLGPDNGFSLAQIYWEPKLDGAVELLNKGDPENLHVGVHATAERIIFSSNASSML